MLTVTDTHAALTCEVSLTCQVHWIKCSLLNYPSKLLYSQWKERDAQSDDWSYSKENAWNMLQCSCPKSMNFILLTEKLK